VCAFIDFMLSERRDEDAATASLKLIMILFYAHWETKGDYIRIYP
jgi:hypothetical protein